MHVTFYRKELFQENLFQHINKDKEMLFPSTKGRLTRLLLINKQYIYRTLLGILSLLSSRWQCKLSFYLPCHGQMTTDVNLN